MMANNLGYTVMPVTKDKSAPYAPPSTVLDIVERHRQRGIPSPVDAEVLARAGIPDSLIPRTLKALQTLDLIGENGSHTDVLEGLRLAPETEYKARLAEWLNAAYADVREFVDPANDDEAKIRDAFRPFKPTAQQSRMVTLFSGLYAAAGIAAEKPVTSTKRARSGSDSAARRKPGAKASTPKGKNFEPATGVPAPLAGLLSSLPPEGQGWTQERRNKFVDTFGAVIDFCFPIMEQPAPDSDTSGQEDLT